MLDYALSAFLGLAPCECRAISTGMVRGCQHGAAAQLGERPDWHRGGSGRDQKQL
jgi:hypothetical protein